MAFRRKGAPIGNKNAAGKHHGHFGSGALKAVGRGLKTTAKVAGGVAAVGAITAGTAIGAGALLTSQLENNVRPKKRNSGGAW